ncbi:octopamine receptor Oamb-like [Mya arenaria]|uniref:octopamine receptor Oamb-like n=1 Tax=Mya arenaria TaxID=6604 RepID=UPI0022E55D2D|nr:octopamine receptor Oamb-like [Mya arenaria]
MPEDVVMMNQTQNGDELIENQSDLPDIVVITCMLSLFSIIGTTGNAFVLYVFSKKKDKNTSTVFILALASIDFVTCILVIPFTIAVEFQFKKIDSDLTCKIYMFLITSNVPFSSFIMVAIALDRYFCICRPWTKFLNTKCALRIIFSLLAFAFTLGLMTSLAHGVYHRKVIAQVSKISNMTDLLHFNVSGFTMATVSDNWTGLQNPSSNIGNYFTNDGQFYAVNTSFHTVNGTSDIDYFVFTGFCYPNEVIFSTGFRRAYQKFYASLFLIAFITVFFLYALIYRSIILRRSRRLKTSLNSSSTGRRSTLLTSICSRNANTPETVCMEECKAELNNTKQEKINNDDAAMMPVSQIPSTISITSSATQTSMVHSNSASNVVSDTTRHVTNDTNREGSNRSSTSNDQREQVYITSNDLKPPNGHMRRPRGNTIGKGFAAKKTDLKNVNQQHYLCSSNGESTPLKDMSVSIKVPTSNMHRKDTRKSVREKHRIANIKTAGILFIVTIVFMIAFLPAWLMATKLIPPNMIVFYSYFIYNVANPVIYAFFNKTFQKEMKLVLKCSESLY